MRRAGRADVVCRGVVGALCVAVSVVVACSRHSRVRSVGGTRRGEARIEELVAALTDVAVRQGRGVRACVRA